MKFLAPFLAPMRRRAVTLSLSAGHYLWNCDLTDIAKINTSGTSYQIDNPLGTPYDGQMVELRIKDTVARTITWDTAYVDSNSAKRPTASIPNVLMTIMLEYDSSQAKWVVVDVDPARFATLDAAVTFSPIVVKGGLFEFVSYGNANQIVELNDTMSMTELGFSSNTANFVFEVRVPGTLSKGFAVKLRREGTAKVKVVPLNTNAIGNSESAGLGTIAAATPAYIANQHGGALLEVRYKADASHCNFYLDGILSTT